MTERPKHTDPDIRDKAIRSLAEDCAKWANDKPDDWLEPLSRCYLHRNGYELAKDVERYAYVEPDAELVEILDGASHYVWIAHREAVKAWVAENNIKPPLAVGTRISCRYGEGRINEIREDEGIYLFVADGETERFKNGGGTHVEYEAAEPILVAA